MPARSEPLAHANPSACRVRGELDLVDEREHKRNTAATLGLEPSHTVEAAPVPDLDLDGLLARDDPDMDRVFRGALESVGERLGGCELELEALVRRNVVCVGDPVEGR